VVQTKEGDKQTFSTEVCTHCVFESTKHVLLFVDWRHTLYSLFCYLLFSFPMNKAFVSSVSLALTLGVVAPAFAMASAGGPAFAYVPNRGFQRQSHRLQVEAIKATRDVRNIQKPARRHVQAAGSNRAILQEMKASSERSVTPEVTKNTHLERASRVYNFRNENRQPKPGSDRYRVLRLNTRFLRRQVEEQSFLPTMIVQTGRNVYDRPTRRDIRENGYFDGILDRDRDVLKEMRENLR